MTIENKYTSNHRVKLLRDTLADKNLIEVAEMIGISGSFFGQLYNGKEKTNVTIDLACAQVLRNLGVAAPKVVVAVVPMAHWNTVSTLIHNLGGDVVVEVNALLADEKYDALDRNIVVFHIEAKHEEAVSMLVKTLGGEIKKVVS